MSAPPDDLAELLARIALGERLSFQRLYHIASSQLFGLILRIVKNQETASEVLQESFIKIWNRASDFSPERASPMTWMGTIARNQAIDTLRRRRQQPMLHDQSLDELNWLAEDALGPDEEVDQALRNQALRECLGRLEGGQRNAVLLAYFNGLTHEELAARLDKPLGTVKSWIRRGLQRLKRCLETL